MSKLYCMCQITGDVPELAMDNQGFGPIDGQCFMAMNRFAPIISEDFEDAEDLHRPVVLRRPMQCIQNGVHQKVTEEAVPNLWAKTKGEADVDILKLAKARRHCPNVDMYRCSVCGAVICVE